MKKITTTGILLMSAIFTLLACKKNIDPGNNQPPPVVDTTVMRKFQFVLESLPGQTTVINDLSAIITITNEQNEVIVSDRKVTLSYNGKYATDTLALAKGNYRVTKFWIVSPSNTVDFATPLTGSAKAPLVTKPLFQPFALQGAQNAQIGMEVLKVQANDKAEDFGYPAGSFSNSTPGDPNSTIRIRVHPLIRVGEVIYDSIPVALSLLTWDANGGVTTTTHILQPGRNDLWLSKAATKYQLKLSKWGTNDEMTLLRNQVQEGMLYSLGGNIAAKKLKEVLNYRLENGAYVPETRDVYNYEGESIREILHYKKRPDGSNYLAEKEFFEYAGGQLSSIRRYNESATLIETVSFTYRADGKLQHILNARGPNQTTAIIDYTPLSGGTGISGNHNISIRYNSNYLTYTSYYNMFIQGGMMLNSNLSTSHGNNETAHYQYDFSINPFAHMNLPDLYLSNYSKHNKVAEQRTYIGSYPEKEPYNFSYSYNSDGYPAELVTKYKTYLTGQHSATIKTVYKY